MGAASVGALEHRLAPTLEQGHRCRSSRFRREHQHRIDDLQEEPRRGLGEDLERRLAGQLRLGHRGANQPVKNLETGRVEITSQNHGFAVDGKTFPAHVIETHVSLFDGTNEGFRVEGLPVFAVQYHPEASPGPRDSHYLFDQFVQTMSSR